MATFDIEIVLFDGFDELDAIGPSEVFDTARTLGANVDVSLVTLSGPDSVTASHGLHVEPDGTLSDAADPPDLLVVPGGGWTSDDGGVRRVVDEGRLPVVAAELAAAGTTVASVCTGAMILAEAGLLDGRPATTHEAALDDLATVASEVHADGVRAVDDGDVLTAGGVTAGIDLALWLVEREFDADVAAAVATELEHERRGTIVR